MFTTPIAFSTPPTTPSPGGEGLNDELQVAWNFNGDLLAAFGGIDLTDNGGVTFTVGKIGQGLQCDFTSYASASSATILQTGSNPYTIAFSVYVDGAGYLISKGDPESSPEYAIGIGSSDGILSIFHRVGNFQASTNVTSGSWYQVVATGDGAGNAAIYVRSYSSGTETSSTVADAIVSAGSGLFVVGDATGFGAFNIVDCAGKWGRVWTEGDRDSFFNGGNSSEYPYS